MEMGRGLRIPGHPVLLPGALTFRRQSPPLPAGKRQPVTTGGFFCLPGGKPSFNGFPPAPIIDRTVLEVGGGGPSSGS